MKIKFRHIRTCLQLAVITAVALVISTFHTTLVVDCDCDAALNQIEKFNPPLSNIENSGSVDPALDQSQYGPEMTQLEPWAYSLFQHEPQLARISKAASFSNDPGFTPSPAGGDVYQIPFTTSEVWGKGGYLSISGRNKCARISYWVKLPEFKRTNADIGVQGSVVHYKWGIGFFPCRTHPPTGFGNTAASRSDGTNGWSVRDQAFGGGLNDLPQPSTDNVWLSNYVYHTNQALQYGDEVYHTQIPAGEWFHMQKLVCLNDVDQDNGYIKTWINGKLTSDDPDYNFTNNSNLLSINRFSLLFYHGGNIPAPSSAFSYISDFKLWTSSDRVESGLNLGGS